MLQCCCCFFGFRACCIFGFNFLACCVCSSLSERLLRPSCGLRSSGILEFVSHIGKALRYNKSNEPMGCLFSCLHQARADVLMQQGISHYERGDLPAALTSFRMALEIRKRLAPDSLTVATSYNNIGLVLKSQGDLERALVEYQKALEIQKRLAPDSLDVARSYNNIGAVLYSQGDLDGALVKYKKALEIVGRLAPDSLTVATSYNNIGAVLYSQGDLEGALVEYQKALKIVERLAPNSLDVATSYNNIGLVLYSQGDLEGALLKYRKALKIQKRLAPDSLDVATSYNNIGLVLDSKGDLEGALLKYRKALKIRERLAPNSLDVAASYNNIGAVLDSQGDLEGALVEYQKALKIRERLAPNSLDVAASYNNIGSVLYSQGDLEGALVKYKKALEIRERLAPNSLDVAASYNNIGSVLYSQGNLEGALVEYQKALEIQKRLAPKSLTVATSYNNIGLVLYSQGDLEGALVEYQKALEIVERLAPNSLDVATSYNNIGLVLYSQGDLEGALLKYRKALKIRERLAPDSLDVATSYNNIGLVLYSQGDLEGALLKYRKALKIRERLAPDSLDVATSYNNIGLVLYSQGDLEGALVEYQKALKIQKQLAPDSLDVAASYNNIGSVLYSQGDLEEALKYFGDADSILMSSRLNLVALHPSKLFCLYNMGEIYLAQNLPDRALEYADRVLNVAPDYKWAYVTRGKALLARGNCEDAIACFDEAISRSPNFGDAHAGKVEAELALAKQLEHDEKLDDAQMERVAETVASALWADPASTDSVDENIKQTLKRAASVGRGQRLQEVLDATDSTALQVPKDRINDQDDLRAAVQSLLVKVEELLLENSEMKSKLAQHGIRFDELEVRFDAVEENLDKIWKEIQQIRVTVDRAIERVIQQRGALSKEQEDRIRKIREDENLTEFFEAFLTELDCIVTMAKAINPDQIDWQPELPLAMSFACMAAQLITLAVTAAEGVPGAASVNKGIAFAFSFVYKVQQKLEYKAIANIASVTQGLKHYDDLLLELALAACEEHSAVIRELPKWNSELGKEFRKNLFRAWADICGFDWDEINDENVKNKLWEKAKESAKGLLLGCVRFYQALGKKDLILIRKENPEKAELFSHMENDKFIELIGRIRAKGLWDKGKLWLFGGEEVSVDSLTRKLVGGKQPLSPAYCYGRTQGRRILYGFLVKGADKIIKYPETKEDESQAQAVIRELQKILSKAEEEYEKKAKKESFLKKLITVERGFASPTAKSND